MQVAGEYACSSAGGQLPSAGSAIGRCRQVGAEGLEGDCRRHMGFRDVSGEPVACGRSDCFGLVVLDVPQHLLLAVRCSF